MHAETLDKTEFPFLNGGGEMGALTRSFDWQSTSIGSPDSWPQSLRTTLSLLLNSRFPMFLFWGPELLCFYNDAYRPSLGNNGKHPGILGMPAVQAWPEIWSFIKPLIDQVLAGEGATWFEDQFLPIYRNGQMENVYWTFSYSPVSDETGAPAGVFVTCTETTDKVFTSERLKENEERLRFALDAGDLGSWELDLQTMEMDTSDHCKINFGHDPKQPFPYEKLVSQIHPNDRQRQQDAMTQTVNTGANYDIEYRIFWPDETLHWVNVRGRLRYDENNDPISMAGISINITDRKNTEEAIKQSEQRFQNLIREATVGIIVLNGPDMHVSIVNDAYGRLINRRADELIGHKLFEIIPETEAYYRPLLEGVVKNNEPVYLYGTSYSVLTPTGEKEGFLNVIYQPYRESGGTVTGVIAVCQDVTEQIRTSSELEKAVKNLERANEQFRLSKEAAQLGTFDMDIEAGTMEWDKRCRTLFGISHDDDVTYDHDFVTGLHPDDRDRVLAVIEKVFKRALSNGDYDVEYRTVGADDGLIRSIRAKGKMYFDENDRPLRFIGSVIDITKQVDAMKRIEELVSARTCELADTNEKLQKSNAELAQFAYIASHDLQEPLRKISTFSDVLSTSLPAETTRQARGYVDKIRDSSARMTTLIQDVLKYSQLVKDNEVFEPVDLNEILDGVLNDFDLLIEQKNASVKIENLPVLQAIRLQMTQLFTNLTSNALKFARKDVSPAITITADEASQNDYKTRPLSPHVKYHKITFSDNGIGIQPQYAERVFHIFLRLHPKSEYEGTGIGLAMCRKIALNHNGDISIGKGENGGTSFVIFFPAEQPSPDSI